MDAPDGTAHYVLALAEGGRGTIRGSLNYLYQDGRTSLVSRYVGELSATGDLTITLANGHALTGTYGTGQLSLADCASALTLARRSGDCRFSYHGHTP